MVSCGIQTILWVLLTILVMILLTSIVYYSYKKMLISNFTNDLNKALSNYCNSLTPIRYRKPVYIPVENGVYERDLGEALVDISFNVSKSNCDNITSIPNPIGFTNQFKLEGKNPYSNDNIKLLLGYIFWNKESKSAIIAFTGTKFISQWKADFDYIQVAPTKLNNYKKGSLVHQGFYNMYLSVRNELWKWWNKNSKYITTLYITGHSLGGALSTLCVYDFSNVFIDRINANNSQRCYYNDIDNCIIKRLPIHYSFASPRVGNTIFAKQFNTILPISLRINNTEDFVPQLPPATWKNYTYEHTSGNIPFTISLGSLSKDHIQAYYNLPICADISPCNVYE